MAKKIQTVIHLTADAHEWSKKEAARLGISRSAYIQTLISKEVEKTYKKEMR